MLHIHQLTTLAEIQRLKPYWNELLEQSQNNCFFLTWEVMSTFLEVCGSAHQLLVLVAYDSASEKPCGIAPLMIYRPPGKAQSLFRELRFLGDSGEVTLEYYDFIVAAGKEAQVTPEFCRYLLGPLGGSWDYLWLARVLRNSPNLPYINQTLAAAGAPLRFCREEPCPYLTLPPTWEEYWAGQSKNFRKNWNYKQNTLAREGEVRYLFAGQDVPLEKAFAELVKLNRERWGEAGGSFRTDKYAQFHRALCEKVLARGWLLLVLMTVGDQVVSVKYDFCYAGKIYNNQGGWSPDYAAKSVGWIMIGKLIEWGIAHGQGEYDFLQGAESYKSQWSNAQRQATYHEAYNPSLRGKIGMLLREAIRQARGRTELLRKYQELIKNYLAKR